MYYFSDVYFNTYNAVPDTKFHFIFEVNHFSFGVDGISIFFVLLTTFITPIAIFSSYELYTSSKFINNSNINNKDNKVKDTMLDNKDLDTKNVIEIYTTASEYYVCYIR